MAKGGILLVAEIGILYLTIYNDFTSLPEDLMEAYFKRFEHPELFVRVGRSLLVMTA